MARPGRTTPTGSTSGATSVRERLAAAQVEQQRGERRRRLALVAGATAAVLALAGGIT